MQTSTKLHCCNQMGDKQAIAAYIRRLELLVVEAYQEGFKDGSGYGTFVVAADSFNVSTTLEMLNKIKQEVI